MRTGRKARRGTEGKRSVGKGDLPVAGGKHFIRRRIFWLIDIVLLGLLAASAVFLFTYVDSGRLEISMFQLVSDKVTDNIRIVQLSDLHERQFGKENSKLLSRVENLKPDIIVITGDMVSMDRDADIDGLTKLCGKLKDIAPTYYTFGNHEFGMIYNMDMGDLPSIISETGVTVLDRNSKSITVNGTDILLGGFYRTEQGYAGDTSLKKYLTEFGESDDFKIMLVHEPNVYMNCLDGVYDFDVAFSGHAHGGQVRLPVIGPLFAPDQGLFPSMTAGLTFHDSGALVVSRGLGNTSKIPRINNNPEIVVLDVNWY